MTNAPSPRASMLLTRLDADASPVCLLLCARALRTLKSNKKGLWATRGHTWGAGYGTNAAAIPLHRRGVVGVHRQALDLASQKFFQNPTFYLGTFYLGRWGSVLTR